MPTVTEDLDLPAGVQPTSVIADVQLVGAGGTALGEAYDPSTGKTIAGYHSVRLDAAGVWSSVLASNEVLVPAGTAWRRQLHGPQVDISPSHVRVPQIVAVSAAARTANVVTATVPFGHGLTVGRTITVDLADNTYDGTFVVASLPTSTTLTWSQVAADDPSGGAGTISGSYRVDELLADPPASIASPALSAHAADPVLHKGGQELAVAQMTVDQQETGTTYVDVTGSTITFDAPTGPYVVHAQLPVRCSAVGVIINVSLTIVGAPDVGAIDIGDFIAGTANHRTLVDLSFRVPSPLPPHTPAAGSQVSYKLRMRRGSFGAAGTVETFFFNIFTGYVRAYTLGKGP